MDQRRANADQVECTHTSEGCTYLLKLANAWIRGSAHMNERVCISARRREIIHELVVVHIPIRGSVFVDVTEGMHENWRKRSRASVGVNAR